MWLGANHRCHRTHQQIGQWAAGNVVDPQAQLFTSAGGSVAIAINAYPVQVDRGQAAQDHDTVGACD
jgi:hypothetical protein